MAPKKYDINTEDQLYSPANVGDTVNPDLMKSPKTTFGQQMQSSKAVQDGLRGAYTKPKPQGKSGEEKVNGNGFVAGQAPKPTMYGQAFAGTALDPRYILTESIIGSIANLYQVSFSGFPIPVREGNFVERELGLLCADASLPATSFGTLEVNGHFQGRTEVFAHTRIYPSLSLTFYETLDHKTLMFFEEWQRSMTQEGSLESRYDHFYRMKFPEEYKCDSIFITKFEKNYSESGFAPTLVYQFIRAFPKNVSSVPVAYGQSEFTKVTVEFAYDRYIVNPVKEKAETNPGYNPDAPSQELVREDPPTPAAKKPIGEEPPIPAVKKPISMRNRMRAPGEIYGGRPAPASKPAPTIESKPSNTKDAPVRTGQNSFDLGGGASFEF